MVERSYRCEHCGMIDLTKSLNHNCLVMPLMLPYGEKKNYPDAPESIPFAMLDEKMADTVHSQTLQRLAERGGLCPSEMLALMTNQNIFRGSVEGIPLMKMEIRFAIDKINEMLLIAE